MSPKVFANTPYYVLKDGARPTCPTISFDDPDTECTSVFGFSDKPIYDKFIKVAGKLLTPYPLVKGYLSNQIAMANSTETSRVRLAMVILDATEPTQPVVSAATMAAVLRAQQENAKQVPVEFELVFDPETDSYQVAGESTGATPIEPSFTVN